MRIITKLLGALTPLDENGFLGFSNGRFRVPGTNYQFDPANTYVVNRGQDIGGRIAKNGLGMISNTSRSVGGTPYAPTSGSGGGGWGNPNASGPAPQTSNDQQFTPYSAAGGGDTVAAEAAQRASEAAKFRSQVGSLVKNITGVYDALYGDVDVAASEKSKAIAKRYSDDESSLTGQFNEQFPLIGNAYAGRGTYDSSYRVNKEEGAKGAYGSSLKKLSSGREDDLAEVGRYIAEQRANFGAQKKGLDNILEDIDLEENPDNLRSLRNKLDARLNGLEASRAGLRSRKNYLSTLNERVPEGNRIIGIRNSLTNVLQSAVPGAVKKQIGAQLIQNSGLSGTAAAQQLAEFNSQVDEEDQLQQG